MENETEYANELIDKYTYKCFECDNDWKAINSAIIDVENTIEALMKMNSFLYVSTGTEQYYQNVLQILKDKL